MTWENLRRLPMLESDFLQSRRAYKERDFYEETWELTVGILPVKSDKYSPRNAVFTVNVKIRRKR